MKDINVSTKMFGAKNGSNIFYHYTSADALKSIIIGSSLRFTNCLFLNDVEEYNYILKLIEEEFGNKKDSVSKGIIELMNVIYGDKTKIDRYTGDKNIDYYLSPRVGSGRFYNLKKGEYYVLSGTIKEDYLPMWIYYSGYLGYSIRMDIKEIIRSFKYKPGEILYGKIIYDRKKQVDIITEYSSGLLDIFYNSEKNDSDIDNLQGNFYEFLQKTRLFFKRDGFKNEKEFRIVILVNREDIDKADFFVSNGIFKPYIELKFEEGLPIKEIMMSPSIDEQLGVIGLKTLLNDVNHQKYKDVFIKKSELQLRY